MTYEKNPNAIQPEIKAAWVGGPDRLWSAVRCSGASSPQQNGGFAGSYVCHGCQVPVAGVYRVKAGPQAQERWLCAACRHETRPQSVKPGKRKP